MNYSFQRFLGTSSYNIFRRFVSKQPKTFTTPAYVMEPITPILQKIESDYFKALFTPELAKVQELFGDRNYELRIAGGAVRDLLMGIKPADVDFASTATPYQMKAMFTELGIRMLHKRGEDHGTITVRIHDKENFEITTLRVDVVCDGRRAQVEYTTNWQLDANRRDLTINSLFLDLEGNVIDYFGGIEDIKKRRIAFVGNSAQRIQEDYLRILRYFRFFGRISNSPEHEQETLQAIIENKDGLSGVSPERIWMELKKIVIGRMAGDVMKAMLEKCTLNKYLGLPDKCNTERFAKLHDRFGKRIEPMTMISSLCEHESEIADFHRITKLSNDERELAEFLLKERQTALDNIEDDRWWEDKIMELEVSPGHHTEPRRMRTKMVQLAKSIQAHEDRIHFVQEYETKKMPVNGKVLIDFGVERGPGIRNVLTYLYNVWKESRFNMTKEELLGRANDSEIPDLFDAEATRGKARSPYKSRSSSRSSN